METTDIFIRTYAKDVPWLRYCLRSIQKFCTGFRQVIIAIPKDQIYHLDQLNITAEKVVGVKGYAERDYIGQQVTKIQAHKYSNAQNILFFDSDTVFKIPVTPQTYMLDGKIFILKTKWEHVGEAIKWKPITEKALGHPVSFEFMRRLPLMYRRDTLAGLEAYMEQTHGCKLEDYAMRQPGGEFSEFNLIGAYADRFQPEQYNFVDTQDNECWEGGPLPEPTCIQHWSWGGLTNEKIVELEKMLE